VGKLLPGYHRESLYRAAITAIQSGNFDQANTLIKKSDALKKESPKLRSEMQYEYFEIARALAAAGRRSAAVERLRAAPVDKHSREFLRIDQKIKKYLRAAVPKLPDGQPIPKNLTHVARTQTNNREHMRATSAGERQRAKELLLRKLPHVAKHKRRLMIVPLFYAGATDEAFTILSTLSDTQRRAIMIHQLSRTVNDADEVAAVRKRLALAGHKRDQLKVLVGMAISLHRVGDAKAGQRMFDEAMEFIRENNTPLKPLSNSWWQIVHAGMAQVGRFDLLAALATSDAPTMQRFSAAMEAALNLAQTKLPALSRLN